MITPVAVNHEVTKTSGHRLSTRYKNCTNIGFLTYMFMRIKWQINELQFISDLDKQL